MSGAITELVAQGVQDTFLTGTPTMSFFKQVFKQHTNFSQEKIRQVFKAQPVSGGMSSVIIKRSGDLIGDMYLIKDDSDTAALTNTMAAMVDKFELYIGGQKIDEYTGSATGTLGTAGVVAKANALGLSGRDMTPLYFFNCNDFSSYIPLVALQYHDVEIRIHWSFSCRTIQEYYTVYQQHLPRYQGTFCPHPRSHQYVDYPTSIPYIF